MLVEQERRLRLRLDPFGDHLEPEIVRHGDQRAHDGGVLGVVGDVAHEAAVDLDAREREAREIAQRGIAGAEIVERELDAPLRQLSQNPDRVLVVERDVLGDLELERLAWQAGVLQGVLDAVEQRCAVELGREQLDADAAEPQPHGAPSRRLRAGGVDDPAADVRRDGAARQGLDERPRRQDAALRMPPTQQRLGAHHGAVAETDLRLKIELELVLREGPPQLEIEPAPGLRLGPQDRHEQPIGAAAAGFGLIERQVGIGDQVVDIHPVVGCDG